MNASARVTIVRNEWIRFSINHWILSTRVLGIVLLVSAILAAALMLVYVKTLQRDLYNELQVLEQTRDNLHIEWNKLLLEQNTWAAPIRVQTLAQEKLNMIVPTSKNIIVVSLARQVRKN